MLLKIGLIVSHHRTHGGFPITEDVTAVTFSS